MMKAAPTQTAEVLTFPFRARSRPIAERDTRGVGVTPQNEGKPKENLGFPLEGSRIHVRDSAPCHAGSAAGEGSLATFRAREAGTSEAELRRRYKREVGTFRRIRTDQRAGKCCLHSDWRTFKDFILGVGPMGVAPRTLDRENNDDPEYGPDKVRWATAREQANNRSTTTTLRDADGTIRPLTEWARMTRQNPNTMRQHRRRGWSDEEIIAGKRGAPMAPSGESAGHPAHSAGWPSGVTAVSWERAFGAFRRLRAHLPLNLHSGLTKSVLMAAILPARIHRIDALILRRFPELEDDEAPAPSPEALNAFEPHARRKAYLDALHDAEAMANQSSTQRTLLSYLRDRRNSNFRVLFEETVHPHLPHLKFL